MHSDEDLLVSAWVRIGDATRVDYDVFPNGTVEFSIGDQEGLALVTTERGLQNFLDHAGQALLAVQEAIASSDED